MRERHAGKSLNRHLADQHEIYQQQVVAKELLEGREGVTYKVASDCGKLRCPFPLCKGELASGWMMRRHFRDLHPSSIMWLLQRKGDIRGVHVALCKQTLGTWHTITQRSAGWGRRGDTNGTWQCNQHLPCASNSRCMGMYWNWSRFSDTSAAYSRRMTMTSKPCGASSARHVGCRQGLARCCEKRIRLRG